jgi:hypothetical protein
MDRTNRWKDSRKRNTGRKKKGGKKRNKKEKKEERGCGQPVQTRKRKTGINRGKVNRAKIEAGMDELVGKRRDE